jgi:hypothetical protein
VFLFFVLPVHRAGRDLDYLDRLWIVVVKFVGLEDCSWTTNRNPGTKRVVVGF